MEIITIDKHDTIFKDVRWALRARSRDSTRYVIGCVSFFRKTLVATDGHRLHMATFMDRNFKAGTYQVVSDKASQVILKEVADGTQYPDWRKVINVHGKKISLPLQGIEGKLYTMASRAIDPAIMIDYTLFMDALSPINQDFWTMFVPSDKGQPIKFRSGNKTAIIMPATI